ncbi:hypothetical protein BD309DRAFT_952522 [Dichomitus squalens]|nr:hypothetical protein BD309DRAFT_952522 [Dichomitus squalens]
MDSKPWKLTMGDRTVTLDVGAAKSVTVTLGLDFASNSIYFVRVDVVSDAGQVIQG